MEKLKIIAILISFIILSSASIGLSAETSIDDFTIMTENYPPYNFESNGCLKGIAVDLLEKMFKKMGAKKRVDDIKLLPWARAYRTIQAKEKTCLFSMVRSEHREHLFKWVGPIAPLRIVLIALKSKRIKINTIDDLSAYRVGAVRDDIGEQLLVSLGVKKESIDLVCSQEQNILKLVNNRIDICVYPEYSSLWQIENLGFDPKDYESIYLLKKDLLYYAFHKNTDDTLIEQCQNAINELKSEGIYQKILNTFLKQSQD